MANNSEPNTDLLDVSLIKSYIEQVDLRYNIIRMNIEYGNYFFSSGQTMTDLFTESIQELLRSAPFDIIETLQDESTNLELVNTKLDIIMQKMEAIDEKLEETEKGKE